MKIILGSRLKQVRGGRSQVNMAKLMGVSQSCWQSWETDNREPDATAIRDICLKFECDANWLLGLTEDKTTTAKRNITITERIIKLKKEAVDITSSMNELVSSIDKITGAL